MPDILIIDDEKAIRKTLSEILSFEGYTIEEAADGEEGLKKFGLKNYDVVLCDIKMPKIDGIEFLEKGGRALDAVEVGAISIENKIDCCVGLGGYPDRDGIVTLDACVMDEHSNCGAVAGMEDIKHPISVARKVMENSPHVLLVGNGAQQFALENGFTKEPKLLSKDAQNAYKEWVKKNDYKPEINIENKKTFGGPFAPAFFEDGTPNHDTMG